MLGLNANRRTREPPQNICANRTILKETQMRDLLRPIPVTGSKLFGRSLLQLASGRIPRRLLHSTSTGATTSDSFCTFTSTVQTCFTQSLLEQWMLLLKTSVTRSWTRETKNTGERRLLISGRKTTGMQCCELRYEMPLENHLASIAALSTLKS